jgi:hypothetical protein
MASLRQAAAALISLGIVLIWQQAGAFADDTGSTREEQHRDLHSVIALAGHYCGAIVAVVENGPSDYSVRCRNGRQFQVQTVDGKTVHVVDQTPGAVSPSSAREDHRALVERGLFAIVNLSGNDCDEVTRFEQAPQLEYRVWCRNGKSYRITVSADGQLDVASIH